MISTLKKIIKILLPKCLIRGIRKKILDYSLIKAYFYDCKRYMAYSATNNIDSRVNLEAQIIKGYHSIEKGLTMPEIRLGFGGDKIMSLIDLCEKYINNYGVYSSQVKHALDVINEYKDYHKKYAYTLSDKFHKDVQKLFKNNNLAGHSEIFKQIETTKEDYFKYKDSSFIEFSSSRKSVRNFTNEDIPLETIKTSINVALNAPSACNRQASRVYLFSDKKGIHSVLACQNGNRGFDHLVNKLIVITAELGAFGLPFERNQAFIDGGIFAMNMLYALHVKGIACCMLNCSNTPQTDKALHVVCKTKKSEVFIAMIACGFCPDVFSITASPRHLIDEVFEMR